jgi:hypothetical protein
MTTFRSLIGETRYVFDLPEFAAIAPSAAVVALVGAATLVRTRGLARGLSIPPALSFAAVSYLLTRGSITLFVRGSTYTALGLFPRVFDALAMLAAATALAFVLGLGAAIDGVARRARLWEYIVVALALALSIVSGCYLWRTRSALGSPNAPLPQLLGAYALRVQAGASIRASVALSWPANTTWIFRSPARAIDPAETARLRAECFECSREISGVTVGRDIVMFRARVGAFSVERMVAYDVEDSRGDPQFPLRVGARWTFRERLESTTRAGGWGIAMAEGLSHLTPQTMPSQRFGEGRRELRVERSFVEDGIRYWELHSNDSGVERTLLVYGHDGTTWRVEHRRNPWQERHRFVDLYPNPSEPGVGAGVIPCRIHGLDFTHCSNGTNPRIPRGPVRAVRREGSGQGAFIAAVTLGAVVPGAGRTWAFCLDQYTEGTGVEMPVRNFVADPPPTADPSAERTVLCEPPAPVTAPSSRESTRARPGARVRRGRTTAPQSRRDPLNDYD